MSKNTTSQLAGKKSVAIALLCGVIGLILIIAANCDSGASAKKETAEGIEALDPERYAQEMEEKVEELCNKIDGVSSAYAVVTLEGGFRAIYATDTQAGSASSKKQTVTLGNGSAEHALLLGYENPKISGIGIVCSGGDDPVRRKNVIAAVSSAFNVASNKIFVAGT